MRAGEFKNDADKVMTKRQVAGLLYGAYRMRDDPKRPAPWAFDAFLLMYLLGLRIGEVIRLRYSHVGKRSVSGTIRSVMVPTEKKMRGLKRIDPLDALFEVPVLSHHAWLAKSFDPRTRTGRGSLSQWLFPSPRNADGRDDHVSDRIIDYAFREARDRAGLSPIYSSHALRHTSASEIARAVSRRGGGEAEVEAWVGAFLRHSKKVAMGGGNAVTRTYIHLAPRNVAEWAGLAADGVLDLPVPLAPCGPSRFNPERRFGR